MKTPEPLKHSPIYPDEDRDEQFSRARYVEGWNACLAEVNRLNKSEAPAAVEVPRLAELLNQARSALNYVDECCSRTIPCAIELDRVNDIVAKIDEAFASQASTASEPAARLVSGEAAQWLFVQMGDEGQASLTWCPDRASILWAVTKAVFSNPLDKLDEDESQQVEGITDSLIEDGFFDFEGDPGLKLFRIAGNGIAPNEVAGAMGEVGPTTSELQHYLSVCMERVDRARRILTDNNPRPECNWGVLDTADVREGLRLLASPAAGAAEPDTQRLNWLLPNLHPANFGMQFEWDTDEEFLAGWRAQIDQAIKESR